MSHGVSITDLSARVVEAARASHATIITVESCTAGSLCTLLADTPGAGDVLLGGFVTYAKSCKSDVLGIPQEVISSCSAVSAEVTAAMANGGLSKCTSATIAIAITCVGGPEPDDDGNPIGLTHVAVQVRNGRLFHCRLQIDEQSPGRVRGEALAQALRLTLEALSMETR
jgi:nicotinamide-nucleotide amidase